MQSPLPAMGRGEPEFYESPAQVAGDLNVSLLGTLARVEPEVVPPFAVTDLVDPGASYDAIVGRVQLLFEHMPLKLLGCLGLDQDPVRFKLAANLAARLARSGRQVTIVEAELRTPAFAGDPARREGLIDMLLYGCSYAAVARESGVLGVNLITAGSHPWSGEPIHGDEWERVLGALRRHSDLTLVTTTTALPGPILSMLARRLDSILIAYGLDAVGRDAVRRSYLTLWDMDAPILGLVTAGPLTADRMVQPPAAPRDAAPEPGAELPAAAAEAAPGTAAGAAADWANRFWDAGTAESVPGFDLDDGAEVVIRETTEVDESAASLWAAEVARLRGAGAPPIGVSPFLSETKPKPPAPPEIPEPQRFAAGAPDAIAPAGAGGTAEAEGEAAAAGASPAGDDFAQSFEAAWDRLTRGVSGRGAHEAQAVPPAPSDEERAQVPPAAGESAPAAAWESAEPTAPAEEAPAIADFPAAEVAPGMDEQPASAEPGEMPAWPAAEVWSAEEMPAAFEPEPEVPAAFEPEPEVPAAFEREPEVPALPEEAPVVEQPPGPSEPREEFTWDEPFAEPAADASFREDVPPPPPFAEVAPAFEETAPALAEVTPALEETAPAFEELAASSAGADFHDKAEETAPGAEPIPERSLFADLLAPASAADDGEEVAHAIEELEAELGPQPVPAGPAPNRTPWRVLVIGGLVGIGLVVAWAYRSEVIRFGPRPPRSAAIEKSAEGLEPRAQATAIPAPGGGSGGAGGPAASAPAVMAPAPTSPAEPAASATKPPVSAPASAAKPAPVPEPAAQAAGAAPQAPERITSATPIAPGSGPYGVHVSSFRTRAKAEEDLSSYRALGFDGVLVSVEVPGKGTWLRVMLGPYPSLEEANRIMEAVRADELSPAAQVFTIPR